MDVRSALKDWIAHRDRFCAEATAVAGTLAAILHSPLEDREEQQAERCFSRLARLRGDLAALVKEQKVIASSPGYRELRFSERRALDQPGPFLAPAGRQLEYWNRVIKASRIALGFETEPLFNEDGLDSDPDRQQWAALDKALMHLNEFLNPRDAQDDQAKDDGYFTDIPLPTSVFMDDCHAAYRVCLAQGHRAQIRFLDVGCGSGMKSILASQFFAKADGLEVDPGFFRSAHALMSQVGRGRSAAIQGDALRFEGYKDYEVIYFYQPIRDSELLQELERQIVDHAFAGTVLIAPYADFQNRGEALGCGQITRHVWVTQTSQEEAEDLARRAAQMGTVINPLPLENLANTGVLLPVAQALDACGFGIG